MKIEKLRLIFENWIIKIGKSEIKIIKLRFENLIIKIGNWEIKIWKLDNKD